MYVNGIRDNPVISKLQYRSRIFFLLFLAKYRLGLALATWFSTMVQWKDKNTFAIKAHTNQGAAWSDLLDLFYFISNQHLYFYINKTKLG